MNRGVNVTVNGCLSPRVVLQWTEDQSTEESGGRRKLN